MAQLNINVGGQVLAIVTPSGGLSLEIDSTPTTTTNAGHHYQYTVTVTGNDGNEIVYTLPTAPTGMVVDSSLGIITWITDDLNVGTHNVTVRATAGGSYVEQAFQVVVSAFVGTEIDADWLTANGPAPYHLSTTGRVYRLQTNVTTDGTAFVITNTNITLNLNGYTITYANEAPISITNHSFESGLTGWDVTNAPNAVSAEGDWLSNTCYDGDYALKFQLVDTEEYVESSAFQLAANRTYCFTSMMYNGPTHYSGASLYMKLISQDVGGTDRVTDAAEYSSASTRGIQLQGAHYAAASGRLKSRFKTGVDAENYKFRIGAKDTTVKTTYVGYVDDVKVRRYRAHGIVVGPMSWNAAYYPDAASYGYGTNAKIINGTITQGQNDAVCSSCVITDSTCTVESVTATTSGADSHVINGQFSTRVSVRHCNLTNNAITMSDRDNNSCCVITGQTTIASNNWSLITDNNIHNGPHRGVLIRGVMARNTIKLKARYTNPFALQCSSNNEVYDNVIDCDTGDYAARGIMVSNGKCYRNTIKAQAKQNNQEYGYGWQYVFGIQVETPSSTSLPEVYDNDVTVYARESLGFALRFTDATGSQGAYIHDNVFRATHDSLETEDIWAAPISMNTVDDFGDANIRIEDNTFETNSMVTDTVNVPGIAVNDIGLFLRRNHWVLTGTPATTRVHDSNNWNGNLESHWKWIDNTYEDAATKTLFCDNGWRQQMTGNADTMSSITHAYTTTFRVLDALGSPVSGATVVVVDKDTNEVLNTTTNSSGLAVAEIDEYTTTGITKASHSPYTVTASHGGDEDSEVFTADQIQTITVQFAGT